MDMTVLLIYPKNEDSFRHQLLLGHSTKALQSHYNVLKTTPFPKVQVINLDEFMEILKNI
jgi:hypothetical protein